MFLIDKIAEQKIAEAIQRGELNNLAGSGKPLRLEDDSLIPEELRAGYRLLKNAGYLPTDVQLRKDINSLESLLAEATNPELKQQLSKRLQVLLLRLGISQMDHPLIQDAYYREKLSNEENYRDKR